MMNILAAFIFFTRLPFWKIREVPAECFKHVVPYWPLSGWLTGGIMAGVLWLTGQILPISIAWIIAIIARLLVTGMPARRRFGRFLRRLWRGHYPRTNARYHEGFAYRQLWSYRIDILLYITAATQKPSSEFPLHSCFFRRLLV